MRAHRSAQLFFLVALGLACNTPPAQNPDQVLDGYAEAIEKGDTERAWALLSDEAQARMPYEIFCAEIARDPAAARTLAKAILDREEPTEVTATFTTPEGDQIKLVLVEGRWRLSPEGLDAYSQNTPEEALHAFTHAVRQRRYDVLWKLAPKSDRAQMDEAKIKEAFEGEQKTMVADLVISIEQSLPQGKVEIQGNRATVPLASGGKLGLVLEEGLWRIEDWVP